MSESHQKSNNAPLDDEAAANPLLQFLDRVEHFPDVVARRRRSYELLQIEKGAHIADVGCGAGTAVFEMDELVRPGGSIIGIDISESLLAAARARAARRGIHSTLQIGNAEALPFADGSLHGYRAERLYQHVAQPNPLLKEAHRVLAPGGRIVLVDQDWDGVLLDSHDLASTRMIARTVSGGIANSAVGRQYYRLLQEAGFVNVQVFADTHVSTNFDEYNLFIELWAQIADATGILDSRTIEAWVADQRNRGATGRFFMAMTHFIALGHR
jgi:ubiquinone/menaquinone biosynthesis C-methylase UbiE